MSAHDVMTSTNLVKMTEVSFFEDPLENLREVFLAFVATPNAFWISSLCYAVAIPAFGYMVVLACKSAPFNFFSFSWIHITASQFVTCGMYMNLVWLTAYFYFPTCCSKEEKSFTMIGFMLALSFLTLYIFTFLFMLAAEADSTLWNVSYYIFQFCGLITIFSNVRSLSDFDEAKIWKIFGLFTIVCYVNGYIALILALVTWNITDNFDAGCWGLLFDFVLIDIAVVRVLSGYRSFRGMNTFDWVKLIFVPGIVLCDVQENKNTGAEIHAQTPLLAKEL